ncbi:MAG TPA: DNA-formamidopyrimidine glycosylase family protein [Gemmatimonadaceae bacterium]|nr:DNA-formamidopyrimidine glycosylase family protein [Gemmatimonadaceae bacterium]
MPELPDITIYVEALRARILGLPIRDVRIRTPFVLRSVDPPIAALVGVRVTSVDRLGKRIVIATEADFHVVLHLMVAGRLKWKKASAPIGGRIDLAALDFETGTLVLTEAGTTKRASIHVVRGADALREHSRGGLEVLDVSLEEFSARLRSENHTVKRALTDPRLFSGIGNAYSDEMLHRARLSPIKLTSKFSDAEIERLFDAVRSTLREWTDRLREQTGAGFPDKVTAFRTEMAVHGRFGQPCPECDAPVQRIRYADNETNYCARCQTDGRLLADRGLSRLLKSDWPRNIDEVM